MDGYDLYRNIFVNFVFRTTFLFALGCDDFIILSISIFLQYEKL
jgi:hypothetical protein